MINTLAILALGLLAGTLSGLFGIGGGTLIVPGLTMITGMGIKSAIGTSLAAMLAPIAVLAVIEYWKAGNVVLNAAWPLIIGLAVGALVGAKANLAIPEIYVQRAFGVYLALVAVKYLLAK